MFKKGVKDIVKVASSHGREKDEGGGVGMKGLFKEAMFHGKALFKEAGSHGAEAAKEMKGLVKEASLHFNQEVLMPTSTFIIPLIRPLRSAL